MSDYLLLGRNGDLISALPFLKAEADADTKPNLVCSNQHSQLFDGVSYVNAVPFDGGVHMLREGFEFAKSKFSAVKSLQVIGNTKDVEEITYRPAGQTSARMTSFVKEIWKLAGKMPLWDDVLPLVFDRRDKERESKLIQSVELGREGKWKKPLMLVSIEGHTSPFSYAKILRKVLQLAFGHKFTVLELPKAERIYDLLGLYELASVLIAVDSAPLHLARACPSLPVIALTNDKPMLWNGSSPQPNHIFYCRYSDFPNRIDEMLAVIQSYKHWPTQALNGDAVLVWNAYDGGFPKLLGNLFVATPVYPGMMGKDSVTVLRDEKRIPYLKDSIRLGMQRAKDSTHVAICRSDVVFSEGAVQRSKAHHASYAYAIKDGMFLPVCDFFCARKSFWKSVLDQIPDLLLGTDIYWPQALWNIFHGRGASDITGIVTREAK